jgi:hypothetical protein
VGEFVNSKQLRFNQSQISCGVMEIHHFPDKTPSANLFAVLCALYHKANPRPTAFIIWSDVVESQNTSRGRSLAEYLKKINCCGPVAPSPAVVNPKTGNVIQMWVWTVNHETARKLYQDELANRLDVE